VQIYALRETPGRAFGDFGDLAASARSAAAAGADALAVSPAHALFLADPDRYSPYAPSTRLWLNGLFGDLRRIGAASAPSDGAAFELIDWSAAWPRRREALRAGFLGFRERSGPEVDRLNAFRSEGGRRLLDHARFEALHARFLGSGQGHWRGWPKEFQDPNSQAVQAFAREQASEVDFHIFLQWLADESLREAQSAARSAGMRIGLIADLAVGTDPGGSHAWSRRDEILEALSIGAPPDLFQAEGQDWGVAGIAPRALLAGGYAAFLETVRAALRNAGGVRIDHAMGLRRLWMVPRGAAAKDGAYVAYPFADLLRLLSLESRRAQAIVSAEDLGTVPPGFREALAEAGVLGMNVLWFQTSDQGFLPPSAWTSDALALTSTHDLPTVAGWWGGRDLAWRSAANRILRRPASSGAWTARRCGPPSSRRMRPRARRPRQATAGGPPRPPSASSPRPPPPWPSPRSRISSAPSNRSTFQGWSTATPTGVGV
jgi:4-alpha-glucanotransferase